MSPGSGQRWGTHTGIEAARLDKPLHLTAVGHSYGSTTTGLALHDAKAVDDAVFFGSPGTGSGVEVSTPHGTEWHSGSDLMNVPDGHLYNLENDGDIIADTGWHGGDPSWDPNLRQMSTHDATAPDGRHLAASEGHGGYVVADDKRSTAEYNLAAVVAGKNELIIP